MDPRQWEKGELKIFHGGPFKIGTPTTLSESQGTKIFSSKIFSHNKNQMLFNDFFQYYGEKEKGLHADFCIAWQ